jgi:molecular chaperone DnaK (HSP70)
MKVEARNALEDYLYEMRKKMKNDSVSSKLDRVDKEKINSAMIKGESLIDGNQQEDTSVFVNFLKELKMVFEAAMNKINKGCSDVEMIIID